MATRADILAEARRWIDTPYHHQQMARGLGCDCVGLVRGVGIATGAMPERPEDWARFNAYGRRPNPRRMLEGMRTFLVRVRRGREKPGDIAWLEWRANLPMHLAILAADHRGDAQLIHAYVDAGKVVAHGVTDVWRGRIVSFWRYPELDQ